MSACAHCKRPIVKSQMPGRVEERVIDEKSVFFADGTSDLPNLKEAKGRMKATYHFRCYFQMRKHAGLEWYKYLDSSPTAVEAQQQFKNRDDVVKEREQQLAAAAARLDALLVQSSDEAEIEAAEAQVALARRQVEIAEEQAKEETPKGEADWRDPATLDI